MVENKIYKNNKMKEEYIIINKTAIQKRIEELKIVEKNESMNGSLLVREEIETLERIISQSTPLIPEIEKAIEYGMLEGSGAELSEITDEVTEHQQDYISNLKLNIWQ